MEKALIFNPAIGTKNLGDEIISECAHSELEKMLSEKFIYEMPTHLPVVHAYQVWRNSITVREQIECENKFVIGSNLLVKNMLTHYPQWNVNCFNYQVLKNCVLVGVGAGPGEETNFYTEHLYKKMLSHEYFHSVRDERSKKFLESLGLQALNTGCVTMWKLTPEFCAQIPSQKAHRVVFTFTGLPIGIDERDQKIIDILNAEYEEVYYWIQGDLDYDYLQRFNNIEKIHIIPARKHAYDMLLNEDDLDYVGTRLHGGIYAMRHKKRAIIIAIDERAREINATNHLNCIEKNDVDVGLQEMINTPFTTKVQMPFDTIQKWKRQFL